MSKDVGGMRTCCIRSFDGFNLEYIGVTRIRCTAQGGGKMAGGRDGKATGE